MLLADDQMQVRSGSDARAADIAGVPVHIRSHQDDVAFYGLINGWCCLRFHVTKKFEILSSFI